MISPLLRRSAGTLCGLLIAFGGVSHGFGQPIRAAAPPEQQRFERISVDDGLSQSDVFVIFQDRSGFVWIGTEDGLNRYDGYDFRVFQYEPFDSTSPANGPVTALYEDDEGHLWLGTGFGGVCRFDRITETFTRYYTQSVTPVATTNRVVKGIASDRDGFIWIGSWTGLDRLDPRTGTIEHMQADPDSPEGPQPGPVHDLIMDGEGILWMTTDHGLTRLDPAALSFTHFQIDMGVGDVSHWDRLRGVGRLIVDAEDPAVLWVGSGAGLKRFDAGSGEVVDYALNPEDPAGNLVTGIVPDPGDPALLWIAMYDRGLYRFEKESGRTVRYAHDARDRTSLSSDAVSSLFADRTGMIWVGTFSAGLNVLDPDASTILRYAFVPGDPNSLSDVEVFAVHEDRSGMLWVGTRNGGLNRIDRATGQVTHWRHDPGNPRSLGRGWVSAVLEDRHGNLWVATTDGGLSRMDRNRGTFDPISPEAPGRDPGYVTALFEDSRGALWVGTRLGGLSRVDPESGRSTRFAYGSGGKGSLAGNAITGITEDGTGAVWVSTLDGAGAETGTSNLCRMEPAEEGFTCFRYEEGDSTGLSSADVTFLHGSRRNPDVLWIATTGGLNRLDTRTRAFTHYTRSDGLPSNHVKCILEDESGRLWLSTNRGISHLDPASGSFRNYGVESGLQASEFNARACFRSDDGELFFGGIGGLTTFHPDAIRANPHAPQVALTGLRVSNKPYPAGSAALGALTREGLVRLPYNRNSITFEYVGLHYRSPRKNAYAYRLDGFDEDWVPAGGRREATYTNLSPGEYTFHVRAANSDGVWNEEGATLQLVILPPWWRTWWAYVAYGLLFLGLVAAGAQWQRRRLIRTERERAALRENQLRREAAEARARYLQIDNSRKTLELEQARELQLSMLPESVPEHPGVSIAAHMQTATEVGGDYYDFHTAADGTLTVAIGDATGHGARAGTMVTAAKSLFTSMAEEQDLAELLRTIGRALRRMRLPRLYMTFALARLRTDVLELAGAGMPPALVVRRARGCVESIPLKGLPLGAPGAVPYEVTRVRMNPGDAVVLMSDGFPELRGAGGRMIGYEGAADVLRDVIGKTPDEIVTHFRSYAERWTNGDGQTDDMTFVVISLRD